MEDVIKNYPNINAGEVNIDTNMALAQKDGIRGVPTVVFYKNGKLLDKMVGLSPAQLYQSKIEALK
jgi:thioredoxin 1